MYSPKSSEHGFRRTSSAYARAHSRIPFTYSYAALLPMHHLWLSYMAELLQLAIVPRTATSQSSIATSERSTTMYPTFPSRHDSLGTFPEPPINVQGLHAKLVKAEFIGAAIRGQFAVLWLLSDQATSIGLTLAPFSETCQKPCSSQPGRDRATRDTKHLQDRDAQVKGER